MRRAAAERQPAQVLDRRIEEKSNKNPFYMIMQKSIYIYVNPAKIIKGLQKSYINTNRDEDDQGQVYVITQILQKSHTNQT